MSSRLKTEEPCSRGRRFLAGDVLPLVREADSGPTAGAAAARSRGRGDRDRLRLPSRASRAGRRGAAAAEGRACRRVGARDGPRADTARAQLLGQARGLSRGLSRAWMAFRRLPPGGASVPAGVSGGGGGGGRGRR